MITNSSTLIVRGTVSDARQHPLPNLIVRAFDRDLRSEQLLGEITTDARGSYEIPYTPGHFKRAEKQSADIAVKVFARDGSLLYEPDMEHIVFNAPADARIDITVQYAPQPTENEFDTIVRVISPLLESVAIARLQENKKHVDVTFLHRETGIERAKIEHLVVAHRLADESKINPAFFYALLHKNTLLTFSLAQALYARLQIDLSSEIQPLLYDAALTDEKIIERDVKRAVAEMIVPEQVVKELRSIIAQLKKLRGRAEEYREQEQPQKMLSLIGNIIISDKIGELEKLWSTSKHDYGAFLAALSDPTFFATPADGQKARTELALAEVLGFNRKLIDEVKEVQEIRSPGDIRKLAMMNSADWKKALTAAAENNSDGKKPDKKVISYHAALLVRTMEKQFPTAAFTAQLQREKNSKLQRQTEIAELMVKHEDFDLEHTTVDLFFKEKQIHEEPNDAVRNELKSLQRVFRLVPQYSKTTALLEHNIHSAHSIVAAGESRFTKEIAPKAGLTAREAKAVYRRAETVHTASLLIVGELQDTVSAMNIEALNMPALSKKLEAISKDFPNLKSLFKGVDLCACEHCRSVYSPAAYLVELLQFLDKRSVVDTTTTPTTTGHLAKDELFKRRPDLGNIDLSCDNAMTPLPYIDLVCELLEEAVAPDEGIAFQGGIAVGNIPATLLLALTTAGIPVTNNARIYEQDVNGNFILRDDKAVCAIIPIDIINQQWRVKRLHQTHGTAEELSAAPEYVSEPAYKELRDNFYAFRLPFDLYHTEARAYFERFGVSRAQLMCDFRKGLPLDPSSEAIAAEILGLTDSERKIIVSADDTNQQLYWNTPSPDAVSTMRNVDHFLTKTGLQYKELEIILRLSFIDPEKKLFIKHLQPNCDTAQKIIEGLDEKALDRLHRFLRLWKKLGWRPDVVNEVIMQKRLGNKTLNGACLEAIANLITLQEQLGAKVEELIGWYGTIPHDEAIISSKKPLYQTVFLNKAVNGFIDENLLPERVDGSKDFADVTSTLALVVQLSDQDFTSLTGSFASTALSFENLSLLYASARLAKKLRLRIADYLVFRTMTGTDIFSSPAATLQFTDRVMAARTSPLTIADVQFILRHEATNLAEREISLDSITAFLKGIQQSYQNTFSATKSPFDPLMKADELKEELKKRLSTLPGIVEEQVNNLMRMVDRQWTTPPNPLAGTYIDTTLGVFFDTTDIKNKQNDLATTIPPNPEYDFESERKALMQSMFSALAAYFYTQEKRSILVRAVAAMFKAEEEIVVAVLDFAKLRQPGMGTPNISELLSANTLIDTTGTPPLPPDINDMLFPNQFRAVRLLHKLFPLLSGLKLPVADVRWYLEHNPALGWIMFDAIPYEATHTAIQYSEWETFLDICSLAQRFTPVPNPADAEHPATFFSTVELLLPGAPTTRDIWIDALALLTGYDRGKLDEIDLYFGFTVPSSYRIIATWVHVLACAEHLRAMGAGVELAARCLKPVLEEADTRELRAALKARYDEAIWIDTLKEIMDSIRPQKRDALVAYLLAKNPDLNDENDLFDYFLVDVEMEACMPSSRIVQAHGTIQLFVQRCLMGLERKAAADRERDKSWEQWKWMRNYRVWEANRKVFLYPENWIEPELLDDKSPLFRELENDLLQNEVNDATTEEALIRYIEKLDEIAFLEVVATYYQTDIYTMHVFARTKGGDPPIYYYRRFEQERYWTPWEKVDLDITSDHLLAFVHNNRLYLAWPLFSEEPNPNQKAKVPPLGNSETERDMQKAARKLKIQLAISEFSQKKWKPKKVSKEGITTPSAYTTDDLPRDKFKFFYNQFAEQIVVFNTVTEKHIVYLNEFDTKEELVDVEVLAGAFDLTGCKGYPELASAKPFTLDFLPKFKDTNLLVQRYRELGQDSTDDLSKQHFMSLFTFVELLKQTPGTFRLTYPHQFTLIDYTVLLFQSLLFNALGSGEAKRSLKIPMGTLLPYFFEDSAHAYVIIPGFYGTDKDPATGNPVHLRRTFTDALHLVEDSIALANKYIKRLIELNYDVIACLQELFADPELHRIIKECLFYAKLQYGEQFKNMYHPLLCMLRTTLYKDGISALMKRETQLTETPFNFGVHYVPNAATVPNPYPKEDLDFSSDGSYSSYNWELFYHAPLLLATRLSKNQRFEEALTWFHYMFNPTGALSGDTPQKYWVTKPFYLTHSSDYIAQRIDTLLYNIADPNTPERKELEFAIDQWRTKPFRPHVVARFRPVAYQKTLLMKYIDNLCEWGDNLFSQDTMESVTQATQLYILADKLLGPKPRIIPPAVKTPYRTYNQLEPELDAFGNALVEVENILPEMNILPGDQIPLPPPVTLSGLYFCIPQNDKMLEYWDRIADRLFKIRHCQNIDGVERTLALFAPPIDPGMLVRAAASGLDISSVIAGLNAPLPYYRFSTLSQKATELISEIRSLGSALLQTLEKKDSEALSLLRNELEMKVLKAVRNLKKLQIEEAGEQIEILKRTKAVTEERNKYYKNIKRVIPNEQLNLDKLAEAHDFQNDAQIAQAVGAILGLIPDFSLGGHGAGGSPVVHATFGGTFLSHAANAAASVLNIFAGMASYEANRASILGGYDRRFDDWKLQERLSKKELVQIDKQIVAAGIRKTIAETDLKNHDLQIDNAQKSDDFMRSKFTNKELYEWMISQISAVYFRAYKLAYDTAKKAERCYQHELGTTDTFLQYGYWDSLKKGLQSADMLFHDLKRMETSYVDKNKREYELTKQVSLASLDPLALVRLRATGSCDFDVPEALFDMDHPGHYFRRVKSVSLTLPCIAGPYTSVSGKLSLVNNRYRKNTAKAQGAGSPKEEYEEVPGNDERFTYNVGSIQSIAASNAQNDSGLFELNFRDERYLPFEGCGAISSWRLELPAHVRQFDYDTISDVIIHIRYTAREGGSTLRALAESTLVDKLQEIKQQINKKGLHLAFNLRHDMPNEWYQLQQTGSAPLTIAKTRLPYFVQPLDMEIKTATFIAKLKNKPASFDITIGGNTLPLGRKEAWNLYLNDTAAIDLDTPFTLGVAQAQLAHLEDLMLVVKYGVVEP